MMSILIPEMVVQVLALEEVPDLVQREQYPHSRHVERITSVATLHISIGGP